MKRKSHLTLVTESIKAAREPGPDVPVGASVQDIMDQMSADQKAIAAAAQAAKAGTATEEQKALLQKLYQAALKSAAPPQLSADKRTVTIPPNPIIPFPIEIPLSDVAEAAKVVEIPKTAIGDVGTGLGAVGRAVGWMGENPRLTLALAGGGVLLWFLGPTLGPALLGKLARR